MLVSAPACVAAPDAIWIGDEVHTWTVLTTVKPEVFYRFMTTLFSQGALGIPRVLTRMANPCDAVFGCAKGCVDVLDRESLIR